MPDGTLLATRPGTPDLRLDADFQAVPLFCENETNTNRLYGTKLPGPFKDGINDAIVHGDMQAVATDQGSKAALPHRIVLAAGATATLRFACGRPMPPRRRRSRDSTRFSPSACARPTNFMRRQHPLAPMPKPG